MLIMMICCDDVVDVVVVVPTATIAVTVTAAAGSTGTLCCVRFVVKLERASRAHNGGFDFYLRECESECECNIICSQPATLHIQHSTSNTLLLSARTKGGWTYSPPEHGIGLHAVCASFPLCDTKGMQRN